MIKKCSTIVLNHIIFVCDLYFRHRKSFRLSGRIMGTLPYYGHKAQEMILTDVSDTIHADSLALFALSSEILLADVTKPEKSKILTLT